MGMQIFEQSGTFRPADWGLKAGDIVQVIAVGGGGGGNGTNRTKAATLGKALAPMAAGAEPVMAAAEAARPGKRILTTLPTGLGTATEAAQGR